ncbi:MAG: aminotransferase class V-fold PLP-dependent enzyme, partial [Candidatus Paceibacteria bacterium]
GAAVERLSYDEHSQEVSYIQDLQSYTMRSLEHSSVPLIWNGKRSNTIPNNIHCSIPGIFAGDLMVYLDIHEIAISTGSACHSGAWTPSHVMQALTSDEDRIQSAIRIGLLRSTTKAEIDRFIAYLEEFATPKTDTQN